MVIVWNEELATGNEVIDNQHKELFKRFNDFQSACKEGKGLDELNDLLAFLGEYAKAHFALEEQLQKDHGYPDYLKHKQEHEGFIRNFKKLADQLNTNGTNPALLTQTNMTLVNWLTRHFTWTDQHLANFIHTA